MKYFNHLIILYCCLVQGCGFSDEPLVTCTKRNLDTSASLDSAIVGQWKYCPPIFDDMSNTPPIDYCDFRSDGSYLTYSVHHDGSVDGPSKRIYAIEDNQIVMNPEKRSQVFQLQEITRNSIKFRDGGFTLEFYAVDCQGLPGVAK